MDARAGRRIGGRLDDCQSAFANKRELYICVKENL